MKQEEISTEEFGLSIFSVIVTIITFLMLITWSINYSKNAIKKEKETIQSFKVGDIVICNPNMVYIDNKNWSYDSELMSFKKDKKIFKALNCSKSGKH